MKSCFLLLFIIFSSSGAMAESKSFYKKFKSSSGILIKGSAMVEDRSLAIASKTIERMISKRVDIKSRLLKNYAEVAVIAKNESYCDLPEAFDLKNKKTFDGRDFCKICGGGGVIGRPITAICEDNLLKTEKDPYYGKEDILTHEFAHTMHILGMSEADKKTVSTLYKAAKNKGNFNKNRHAEPAYMMANEEEFFACLSMVWFNVQNPQSASLSPELKSREAIRLKLPDMYYFLESIYPK